MASSSKALIEHYFAVLTGERSDRPLGEFFAEDVVWHAPAANPLIEPNPRTGHAAVMDLIGSGVGVYRPETIRIVLHRLLAVGPLVGAQLSLSATLASGRDYHNEYFFLFAVAGDRIATVWEYLDTYYQYQRGVFS